jgi:hypothetical protein
VLRGIGKFLIGAAFKMHHGRFDGCIKLVMSLTKSILCVRPDFCCTLCHLSMFYEHTLLLALHTQPA